MLVFGQAARPRWNLMPVVTAVALACSTLVHSVDAARSVSFEPTSR